jgi:hypothetical protein
MVVSKETTPAAYLESLPADRRAVVAKVRAVIKKQMPKGFVETMNWGMICYEIPLSKYPNTYNGKPLMYVALAAQKNNYAIYLTGAADATAARKTLEAAFKTLGKKMDMGGSCLRFKKLEDIPLDVIGDLIASSSVEERIAVAEKAKTKK